MRLLPKLIKGTSWNHQLDGYQMVRGIYNKANGRAGAGLFFDMGTGKTRTAIHLLDNARVVRKVLIVCPKKVIPVWPAQFEEHSAYSFRRVLVPEGKSVRDRAMAIADVIEDFDAGLVMDGTSQIAIVINYETAWREPMKTTLMHCGFDMVILDEAHRLKAPGSQVSKFFGRLARKIPYRLALTGTPLPHEPLDAWSLYRFIDSRIFGKYLCWNNKLRTAVCKPGATSCCFRTRYADMGGYENHQVLEYRNLDELHNKMFAVAMRVKKEDVLDLPPELNVDRLFSLNDSSYQIYEELEETFYADLDMEGEVTPANALVRLLRLQQITNGFVKTDDDRIADLGSDKEELLAEMLYDFPEHEPIVVFYRFTEDKYSIRRAVSSVGRSYAEVSGQLDTLVEWQNGDADVVAVQIATGGEGIDLTRAAYSIFYSIGWSLKEYDQARARLHRGGQTRPVTHYHLIARSTIEVRVYWALKRRREIVESVLTKMRERSRIAS